MKKSVYILYTVIVLGALFLLFAAMPAAGSQWSAQTTDLAEKPALHDGDGKLNMEFLSDWGRYFEDRFAFRTELITDNTKINESVFGETASDQVIAGKDGWLYYSGTMHDYKRENSFTDRQLFNISHNLGLIREYYDILGIDFVLTVAPNKNSVYPGHQPYYILKGEGESNAERLKPYLEAAQINYADLFGIFDDTEEMMYYKQDTHWNALGASRAYETVMAATGREGYISCEDVLYEMQKIHSGDLAEMIYPDNVEPEEDAVFAVESAWEYEGEVKDSMDEYIITRNPEKEGTVYMFRDSFGSALIPYFAAEYGTAVFSRLTPYKISDPVVQKAGTVIIETAERNLEKLSEEAPLMQGPVRSIEAEETENTATVVTSETNGGFTVIKGKTDEECFSDSTEIYIRISGDDGEDPRVYEAFYLSGEEDGNHTDALFAVSVLTDNLPENARAEVLLCDGEKVYSAAECSL